MTTPTDQKVLGLFARHAWSKWEQGEMVEHLTPIGLRYPANVRGREFVTGCPIQRRTCQVCGKVQVEKLL